MTRVKVGIIGGSGLYSIEGLKKVKEVAVRTPFGAPSDKIVTGVLEGVDVAFLPRHGRAHTIPPHRINYRANVMALKMIGAGQIVSVSAVGSMKEDIHPGDVVLPDQFIDRTRFRASTFFDEAGAVAHVAFSDPVDPALRSALVCAATDAGARVHDGGVYIVIDGPQFSTRAESNLYRSWGVDVIGMTNMPEAKLAREAELPYATIALPTDYDCWHVTEAPVTVEAILSVMEKNVALAKEIIRRAVTFLPDPAESPASRALDGAILTSRARVPAAMRRRLAPLCARYFGKGKS
ncbi:MAG: S-methyl-5'-thioadenosine phosphorylase [Deltaproteobacteria bacterium]|nr:S-methyl-5'-thioadenosine phosphorylase [Deltaproteobacteria bacterium]